MLVLTRKANEAIYIGDGIEVVVLEAHGSRVRLGFRAPANVSIRRPEAGPSSSRKSESGSGSADHRVTQVLAELASAPAD